jgi:hypothetical protein
MRKGLLIGLAAVVAVALFIQLIPYGRSHSNPTVAVEPQWSSPQVRDLAVRACYDCHSNETVWPWYTNIAPFSWLVQWDVDSGRDTLNFSEWNSRRGETGEAVEVMREGGMPQWYYTILHPSAKLSQNEKDQLTREFQTLLARR